MNLKRSFGFFLIFILLFSFVSADIIYLNDYDENNGNSEVIIVLGSENIENSNSETRGFFDFIFDLFRGEDRNEEKPRITNLAVADLSVNNLDNEDIENLEAESDSDDSSLDFIDDLTPIKDLKKSSKKKSSKKDEDPVVVEDPITQPGTLVSGACKAGSKETNEGPGGDYCTYDDYEECYDYKTKSTAIAYNCDLYPPSCFEAERGTDYCTNSYTLKEAYINCGLTTLSSDNVEWKTKTCSDYDYTTSWTYSCTSTQVKKIRYSYSYGCSDGACKVTGTPSSETEIISSNGDSDYCAKRKEGVDKGWADCTLCGHGNYDCDWDSECLGSLKCMGPTGGNLDGCCKSSETWDDISYRCCECNNANDPCCDGCNYESSSKVCDYHYGSYYYGCRGESLGDDVLKQDKKRYCSGSSTSCNGDTEYNTELTHDNCGSNEFCDSDNEGYTAFSCSTAQCGDGNCCDASAGNYKFLPSSTVCRDDVTWYGCFWGTDLGDDVAKRIGDKYCDGTSNDCNGVWSWGGWNVFDDCDLKEWCEGTTGESLFYCKDIACSSDLDCGTDRWENLICSGDGEDVLGEFRYFDCKNSGQKNSECSSHVDGLSLKEDCGTDKYTGDRYCKYNDVYQDYVDTFCEASTLWAECDSTTSQKKIKDCVTGCTLGKCNEDTCTDDCVFGEKQCSGDNKQTCDDYDTDTCWEWGGDVLCEFGCETGECKDEPEIECSSDPDCGIDGYVGSPVCTNGELYQTYRTYTCSSPGTTSSSCSHVDVDKKKGDCDIRVVVDLKKGANIFSIPVDKEVKFQDLTSDCQFNNLHICSKPFAYYTPTDDLSASNYNCLDLTSTLYPGQSYFSEVKTDCSFEITGPKVLPKDIGYMGSNLKKGWNIAGSTTSQTNFNKGNCDLYGDIGILKYAYNVNSCSQVSGWNGKYENCVVEYGVKRCSCSVNYFEPGEGYWIRTKNYCNLV